MTADKPQGNNQVDPDFSQGANPIPTRAHSIKERGASPERYASSGMERAMGALADKTHKTK